FLASVCIPNNNTSRSLRKEMDRAVSSGIGTRVRFELRVALRPRKSILRTSTPAFPQNGVRLPVDPIRLRDQQPRSVGTDPRAIAFRWLRVPRLTRGEGRTRSASRYSWHERES